MKKVIVGLSGGIDSSSVAKILLSQGYSVHGVYLKLHSKSDEYHQKNLENIDNITQYLGISYDVVDLQSAFKAKVYDYFVESYINGITPNPCVVCNREIKFGLLLDYAIAHGYETLATGHYAKCDGEFIYEATDKTKDQSYFLAQVPKNKLNHILFPLGDTLKEELKLQAQSIPSYKTIADGKESSEICFVDNTYIEVLEQFTNPDMAGKVVDSEGKVVGSHKGYMHYTIGKRRGFDVPLSHVPLYVSAIDPSTNTLTVGDKESLRTDALRLGTLNRFINESQFKASIKVRYRSVALPCTVEILGDEAFVSLAESAYGVAKGQYGVVYMGEKVVLSGVIL